MTREFQSIGRLGIRCTFHITCSQKILNSALFWPITRRVVVIPYRRFGTPYRFTLQRSRIHILDHWKWDR